MKIVFGIVFLQTTMLLLALKTKPFASGTTKEIVFVSIKQSKVDIFGVCAIMNSSIILFLVEMTVALNYGPFQLPNKKSINRWTLYSCLRFKVNRINKKTMNHIVIVLQNA